MNRVLTVVLIAAMGGAGVAQAQVSPADRPQTNTPRSSVEPTNQSAEEIIIKQKLRAAGLSDLKDLVRNPDGTWEGKGVKDDNEVAVLVDTDGNVRFQ